MSSDRPQSSKLIELHVYVIPSGLWQDRLRSAVNQVISETISAGFVRLAPDLNLSKARQEIVRQLGSETIPHDFIFCKSVGRCLTQVRVTQESELKAYHFLPPNSYCPELFLLDLDTASRSTPSLKDQSQFQSSMGQSNQNQNHNSSINNSNSIIGYDINGNPIYSNSETNDTNNSNIFVTGDNQGYGGYGGTTDENNLYGQSQKNLDGSSHLTNGDSGEYGGGGATDYFQSAMADVNRANSGKVGKINLHDYPNLTSEEIRMLEGMSEAEVIQYLKNNGHMSATEGNPDGNISIVIDGENLYEDDGPQRGGMRDANQIDPDFDDSHMSEMEKYTHYMSLLEKYKNTRSETESRKHDLIKRAKQLYTKTANQKNIARDMWKKKYFEEKKKTQPMDDHLNKQRTELDNIHRKILTTMDNTMKEKKTRGENQSAIDLSHMRIEAKKLEYEIEEAQRAVDESKLKLTCEIKMTHQARAELVALRADLVQKKINLSMARSQQLSNMGTADVFRPSRVSLIKPVGK